MIAPVDSLTWAPADLTANSGWLNLSGVFYAVSGRRSDGTFAMLTSVDFGETWTVLATLAIPVGSMEAALVLGADGKIHLAWYQPQAGDTNLFDLKKAKFDTVAQTFNTPVTLVTGSRAGNACDLVPTPEGGILLVVPVQMPALPTGYANNYALLAFELDVNDAVLSTTPLYQGSWYQDATTGSVSLVVPPNSGHLELFYTSHPKVTGLSDGLLTINQMIRTGPATWGAAIQVDSALIRFTDDKLTVIATATNQRLFSLCYFTYDRVLGQGGSIRIGCSDAVPTNATRTWITMTLAADGSIGYEEPVIQQDANGFFYLSYLKTTRATGPEYSRTGFLQVFGVSITGTLSRRTGPYTQLRFKWLRGTKTTLDGTSRWGVIGEVGSDSSEAVGGLATYVSEYNLAPLVSLLPASATINRGVAFTLDASGTRDPDQDPLTYTWSTDGDPTYVTVTPSADGTTAQVMLAKSVGPLAGSFHVTVSVTDNYHSPVVATVLLSYATNAPPVVTLPASVNATRNSNLTITASVTDPEGDGLRYVWQQISGTPVTLTGANTPSVTAALFRMEASGETVQLRLMVTDDINAPVFTTVNVVVPAISYGNLDAGFLSRAFYQYHSGTDLNATIAQRNDANTFWSTLSRSVITTDFWKLDIFGDADGEIRYLYISDRSATLLGPDLAGSYYRKVFPAPGVDIVDCVMDENEVLYTLDENGLISRFTTLGPSNQSDWPDQTITLSSLVAGSYNTITLVPSDTVTRVLALTGPNGVLLLQVGESDFSVRDLWVIDKNSGILPNEQNVVFIRLTGVTSLKTGQVLIGLKDTTTEETFEALVDLATRRALGQWDQENLANNPGVTTGEILQTPDASALGRPSAPTWNNPVLQGGGVYLLSWTQIRPDLITAYEVWLGIDAAAPTIFATIRSGGIRRMTYTTSPGHTYHFTVRAIGGSTTSAFSSDLPVTT